MGFYGSYLLVMTNIANWKMIIFDGKTHYLDWAIFNSDVSHYQRVALVSSGNGWVTHLENVGNEWKWMEIWMEIWIIHPFSNEFIAFYILVITTGPDSLSMLSMILQDLGMSHLGALGLSGNSISKPAAI